MKKIQKKLHTDRQSSENPKRVQEYFERLQAILEKEGIVPEDIWNMDETGFRIGVGKDQMIVTKRDRAHYLGIPENRESATAIEAISAGGQYIPAFLVLTGNFHMAQWYQQPELDPRTAIVTSASGYSNDQISLEWIKHFELHTHASTVGKKRLLILDGHGSHHTIEFIQYCDNHDIIPFGLPPHLTHLLQPLDVVVFQPLKHYHAKELDIMVRDGIFNITKLEFLSIIETVRKQAFKRNTILSSFRKTGIYPLDPARILGLIEERQPQRTPTPPLPSELQSSPFSTPITLRQMNKVASKLEDIIDQQEGLDPELVGDISRFIRGSLANSTELIQVKRDLGRTKFAEQTQKARRAAKNTPLQSGGVLTVAEGRRMVGQKREDEVARAFRVIEAAELKYKNTVKRAYFEVAKGARKWRLDGILQPCAVYESGQPVKYLRRC
jgi:hypothetical protein